LYSVFLERSPDDKYAGEHFVLPPGAEKDSYRWRLPDGNTLEKEARLAGLFNGVEAEFDLAKTAMKTARTFNADAKARVKSLPLFGLCYTLGAQELVNDRGQNFFGPTLDFVGAVGDPNGPTEEEVVRAAALLDLVESTLAEAKREAAAALLVGDHKRIEIMPPRKPALSPAPRPSFTSGRGGWAHPEAPPPVESYDGPSAIDDDIPF
jgi:hypothetical protein